MFGRRREYRGQGFTVRIDPGFRELVTVVHTRAGTTRKLDGERIGKRWNGIALHLPRDIEAEAVPALVSDIAGGLAALRCGYVITRTVVTDRVSDAEQQAAIAELKRIGFDVQRSPDLKQISLIPIPGVQRDVKWAVGRTQSLVQTLSGSRPRTEVLAVSPDFAAEVERYIPR